MGVSIGKINTGHEYSEYVEVSLNELSVTSVISMHNDIPTSYEIVWAIARTVPRRAYFEFLAQPADIVAYTFNLAIAENRGAEYSELKIG